MIYDLSHKSQHFSKCCLFTIFHFVGFSRAAKSLPTVFIPMIAI